jgi:hypothetical protein
MFSQTCFRLFQELLKEQRHEAGPLINLFGAAVHQFGYDPTLIEDEI